MDSTIFLDDSYQPHLDEHYMSDQMIDYFIKQLHTWRQELDALIFADRQALEIQKQPQPDVIEEVVANQLWLDQSQQLSRYCELHRQINEALQRIEQGTYGYCEQTGEEIGIKRLQAWPIATLSLMAQAYQEHRLKMEKMHETLPSWPVWSL